MSRRALSQHLQSKGFYPTISIIDFRYEIVRSVIDQKTQMEKFG